MNKLSTVLTVLALSGCATCQQHPVACTVATAIVAGSITATMRQHHDTPGRYADPYYGLHTHDCAPMPHGNVALPPGFGGCQ